MPTYTVTDPTSGKTLKLTGDSPPTEAELIAVFDRMHLSAPSSGRGAPPPGAPTSAQRSRMENSLPPGRWSTLDALVDAIPTATGALGGVVGGAGGTVAGFGVGGVPGAIGGAAVGGAGGEALRQLVERMRGKPDVGTPMEALKQIASEGAVQGAAEGAGTVAQGAARVAGRALMENAVRPSMTLVREFPTVVDTLIRERLPVGRILPGVKPGTVQAAEKLGAAAKSVKALLAKATADGSTIATSSVAEPVLKLIDDLGKQPLGDASEQQLAGMIDEFLRRHPGPLTPTAVKELKQQAQAVAKPVYKAVEKGFPVTADQSLNARFNSAIAQGSKKELESLPAVGQKVAAGEQKTQDLIGAVRALKAAETRRLSLMAEGASVAMGSGLGQAVSSVLGEESPLDNTLKQSVVGWAITRGLLSPRSMSRGALVLTDEAAQQVLRQFPRLATEMLRPRQAATGAAVR